MVLFEASNQVNTKNGKRDPLLKSVSVAHLLRSCPAFSAKIGAPSVPNSRSVAGHAYGGGSSSDGGTAEARGPGTRGPSETEGER